MKRHGTPMKARIDKRLTEKGARKRFEIDFSREGEIEQEESEAMHALRVYEYEEEDKAREARTVKAHPVLREALDRLVAEPENEAEIVEEFWATVTAEGFDYNGPNEEETE